jgi:hypothetical protein
MVALFFFPGFPAGADHALGSGTAQDVNELESHGLENRPRTLSRQA